MRTRFFVLGLGLLVTLASARAAVTVEFVAPQHYRDASSTGYAADSAILGALAQHFEALGEGCLRAGESLEIRVLDLDLAGQQEWWHRASSTLRVMRDITWPRLTLDYVWRDPSGQLLGEAQGETVADMDYLRHSAYARSGEALFYEKRMLQAWFEPRFCRPRS